MTVSDDSWNRLVEAFDRAVALVDEWKKEYTALQEEHEKLITALLVVGRARGIPIDQLFADVIEKMAVAED